MVFCYVGLRKVKFIVILPFLFCFAQASLSLASQLPSLNINTATAQQMEQRLPGIGKIKAQAIVEYRNLNGLFSTIDQLLHIKGVGPHTLEKIKPYMTLGGAYASNMSSLSLKPKLQSHDQTIRNDIKRIVTRAKQNTLE